MLQELKLKYPIFNNINLNFDFIIKQIIELNFNEDKIKDCIEIYQELEDDYDVSMFIGKETVIDKIIELNFDKGKFIEMFENGISVGFFSD